VTIQHVAKRIQAWNQLQKINYPHLESGLAKPMDKRCTFKCTPIVSLSYHLANHGYWPEHSVLEKCKLMANTTKQHNSHAGAIWGRGGQRSLLTVIKNCHYDEYEGFPLNAF
jgi:hypothetical protein